MAHPEEGASLPDGGDDVVDAEQTVAAPPDEAGEEPAAEAEAEPEMAAEEQPEAEAGTATETAAEAQPELEAGAEPDAGAEPAEDAAEEMAPPEVRAPDILDEVRGGFEEVLAAFEHKLAYDRSKDRMVDRLHDELQDHKSDLLAKATLPLVNGLIRLHDELGRVVETLRAEDESAIEADRVYRLIEGFQGDVEIVLEDNGISAYQEPGEKFDPGRQQVLKTVVTAVAEETGRVVDRVRPGFERGERIIRKEKVTVARFSAPPEEEPSDSSGDAMEEKNS